MSVAAMLTLKYYFLPPIHTFTISDPQNWVALFAFLATAPHYGEPALPAARGVKLRRRRNAGARLRDCMCSASNS